MRPLPPTQRALDLSTCLTKLRGVLARGPGAQIGDQWWGAAEQDQGGAEGQGADDLGRHDGYAADGPLQGAGAVVTDGNSVGLLVAFADQGGEVLEVAS